MIVLRRVAAARSGRDRRAGRRHRGGDAVRRAGRHDRQRGSAASRRGCPRLHFPRFQPELIPTLLRPALTVAMLGRDRVADVGGRRRPHGRRPAQPERRADRAGHRQHRVAALRRAAGDRARSRAPPPTSAPARARRWPAWSTRSRCWSCCSPPRRWRSFIPMPVLAAILLMVVVEHGRVARDPEAAAADEDRHRRLARHVRADGLRRPDAGGRSRDDPRGAVFIRRVAVTTDVARVTPDYIETGRAHILQDKPIPPYVAIFRIHGPFLFGVDRQAGGDHRAPGRAAADRHPPAAQHDGDRRAPGCARSRTWRTRLRASGRTLLLCGAREQPAAVMQAGAVPRARRRPQHLREHRRGARARRGAARGRDAA